MVRRDSAGYLSLLVVSLWAEHIRSDMLQLGRRIDYVVFLVLEAELFPLLVLELT